MGQGEKSWELRVLRARLRAEGARESSISRWFLRQKEVGSRGHPQQLRLSLPTPLCARTYPSQGPSLRPLPPSMEPGAAG